MKLKLENHKQDSMKLKLFYIGILTIITVVVWIALGVYFTFKKTTVDRDMAALTKPLNPVLNSEGLNTFAASRVPPPEQFTITALVKTEGSTIPTTQIVDPFSAVNAASTTPAAATQSAAKNP